MSGQLGAIPPSELCRAIGSKVITPTAAGLDFLQPRLASFAGRQAASRTIGQEGCDKLFADAPPPLFVSGDPPDADMRWVPPDWTPASK